MARELFSSFISRLIKRFLSKIPILNKQKRVICPKSNLFAALDELEILSPKLFYAQYLQRVCLLAIRLSMHCMNN